MASAERVWVRDYGGDRCHVTLSDACPTSSVRHAKFPSETVYFYLCSKLVGLVSEVIDDTAAMNEQEGDQEQGKANSQILSIFHLSTSNRMEWGSLELLTINRLKTRLL